uniref:Transporter n=1 Tax=Ditylenchus dipsaci TaxID=166011 RepID=A0A915ES23_9BILA
MMKLRSIFGARGSNSHQPVPTNDNTHRQRRENHSPAPAIRTGFDAHSVVAAGPQDHLLIASAPAGRKVSVLGVEVVDRGQWSSPLDFLMSMIAYAVGLGNVWRFPYLCYKNGGGSFLVVYALFFVLGAVPIFIMEVTVGQYLQRGAMEMWKMCPIFKGVGIGNVVIAFMCIAYFCVIVSWAVFYMIASFNSVFPWETCSNYWNTPQCVTGKEQPFALSRIVGNLSRYGLQTETSVEQFWERRVLQQSDSIADFGGIQWELFFIMMASWVVVYFALWKGITQARKFVYFCALFPYCLLIVLLIRGLTLPGAMTGISYYLTPNLTKLTEATVWKDAGTQVFYSYGVGFGTLIALGSHNKFNHNCYRDAFIMCGINGSTSILAGFAIFSILGYMSVVANKHISEIVKPGVGLAFLAYPEVASNLPFKQFWAFLFFLMITILGLDSQVCMMEGNTKKSPCLSLVAYSLSLEFHGQLCRRTLVDSGGWIWCQWICSAVCGVLEVVGLAWGFGAHRVREGLKEMLGFYPSPIMTILWKYTAPLVTFVLFVFCMVMYQPLKYPNGKISLYGQKYLVSVCLLVP